VSSNFANLHTLPILRNPLPSHAPDSLHTCDIIGPDPIGQAQIVGFRCPPDFGVRAISKPPTNHESSPRGAGVVCRLARVAASWASVDAVFALLLSGACALITTARGVPALRQDWNWPIHATEVRHFLSLSWSAWAPGGLGGAAPYPASYLIAIPLAIFLNIGGSGVSVFAFMVVVGAAVTFGALSIIKLRKHSAMTSLGLMAFALFNPWVYTETIAGHTAMVLAYGLTMFVIAELISRSPRWQLVALSLIAMLTQLQIFCFAYLLTAVKIRERNVWKALVVTLIAATPIIIGVVLNWGALSAIPYTVAWQKTQSIAPDRILFLSGYAAGYARPIAGWAVVSCFLIAACAVLGLLAAWRSGKREGSDVFLVLTAVAVLVVIVTGTKGIAAGSYTYLVQRYPVTGLVRELYDLVGYIAIAYLILASYARRGWLLSAFAIGAGATAVAGWIAYPPAKYFVPAASVPALHFSAPSNSRFALFPPFQPLRFGPAGSGADPDVYPRARNVTPLNTYLIQYPAAAALLSYLHDGSTTDLSALSVSTIVKRPYFKSNNRSLKNQLGGNFPHIRPAKTEMTIGIPYIPELTLMGTPRVGAIASVLGSGNVFFGDAKISRALPEWRSLPDYTGVTAPNSEVNPARGWVDARFAFQTNLNVAQWLGGAATSSRVARLQIPAEGSLLVYVRGSLYDEKGRMISGDTHGYRWVRVPRHPINVRCSGFCVVVGGANRFPSMTNNPPVNTYSGVPFKALFPWLVLANVPPHAAGALRYNVTYSRGWFANMGDRWLPHVRLDEVVNGWLVPRSNKSATLVLINFVAAVQELFELVGLVVVIWLVISTVQSRTTPSHTPPGDLK